MLEFGLSEFELSHLDCRNMNCLSLNCPNLDCRYLNCPNLSCQNLNCRNLSCRNFNYRNLSCRNLNCRNLNCHVTIYERWLYLIIYSAHTSFLHWSTPLNCDTNLQFISPWLETFIFLATPVRNFYLLGYTVLKTLFNSLMVSVINKRAFSLMTQLLRTKKFV